MCWIFPACQLPSLLQAGPGARVRPRTLQSCFYQRLLSLLSPVTPSKASMWSLSSPVKSASPRRVLPRGEGTSSAPALGRPRAAPAKPPECMPGAHPPGSASSPLCTDVSPIHAGAATASTWGSGRTELRRHPFHPALHRDQSNNFQSNQKIKNPRNM